MTSGSRAPKHTSTGRCDQRPQPRVAASAAAATLLSVRDLHLAIAGRRRHTPILRGVSLDIAPGEVHGLVGESGAGKTMIGKVILGIQPSRARIVRGSVVFDGRDITHLGEADRRRLMGRGLGLIPQDPMTSLNPRSWRRPGYACPCPTSTASRPSAPRPWSISCTALILRWHPAIPWASSAKAALSRTNPSDRLESRASFLQIAIHVPAMPHVVHDNLSPADIYAINDAIVSHSYAIPRVATRQFHRLTRHRLLP